MEELVSKGTVIAKSIIITTHVLIVVEEVLVAAGDWQE